MKHLLLLFLTILGINCYSQNTGNDLFQTWYLTYLQASDGEPQYNIAEIMPPITPTLTILEDFSFSGEAACNTFNGKFTYNKWGNSDMVDLLQLEYSKQDCNNDTYKWFENSYFNFLQYGGGYEIHPYGQGSILYFTTQVFGSATFQNFALGVNDFKQNQIEIYPIPSNSKIFLNSKITIAKIEIVNTIGQTVREVNHNFDSIDISDLSAGVYFLRVNTNDELITTRIIKN